ncbi:nuclear transport factor 2 family protein [Bradyrhizobium sp. 1(2017)]|uniref:nuclear transport factor 2 family protein n=1 Tax=Bradyrhizobium sp. 1(2017) TaxID=1404888 RepID=UPI00140E9C73|nr:nuclear transport factor 2 family protein [Bradyrhizobium sp. 1(2017)]QIO34342.1 nuclear transport factor 2 family protein [Bradyrhizobium sp. 1(2017)]
MSFDAMAAAVDWLDAYRAGDVENILQMYAEDAVILCGCGGMKTITGSEGRRAYWVDRMVEYPASRLDNLQQASEGALISYLARDGLVSAVLRFNAAGQISAQTCGPSD